MNSIRIFFMLLFIGSTFSAAIAQDSFEISTLLEGVDMNTILTKTKDFDVKEHITGADTLRNYRLQDSHFTFLDQSVQDITVHTKNEHILLIAFLIESKTIDAPEVSFKNTGVRTREMPLEAAGEDDIAEASADEDMDNDESDSVAQDTIEGDTDNVGKTIFINLINENTPITEKVRKYLDANYQAISSQPRCQFDCWDEWQSDTALIQIEKNNFIDDAEQEVPTIYIDQTLIIRPILE